MSGVRHIRLVLEYDGTPYRGWQQQRGLPTVQGELELALARVLRAQVARLRVAVRTDVGVHALGQVVSFACTYPHPARRLAPALNFYLPESIRVHAAEEVDATFDARASARGKIYAYRIYEGPHPTALDRRRAWHVRRRIDGAALAAAAAHLTGEHDFESFRSAHCDAAHAVRRLDVVAHAAAPRPPVGTLHTLTFRGNAFCRHMCRILAGTLVEVGSGARPLAAVPAALAARRRDAAGVTAPGWGLTLVRVLYGAADGAPPDPQAAPL